MEDNVHSPETAAVDISAIENQKENIQPLASGRSAAQLTSLFQTQSSDSHSTSRFRAETTRGSLNAFNPIALAESLRSGHQGFQKDIERLEKAELGQLDDLDFDGRERAQELIKDPLEIHVEYVRWIIKSYPSGGTTAESKLIPILERSTRKFVTDERYQQDLRYLKLWIYYSHQVQREAARTIFSFLLHKKIGTESSLLYDEFSLVLCHFRDYEKARYVLQLGIDRKASPIEKLSTRMEDVQQKLAASLDHPPSSTECSSNSIPKAKLGLAKKPVKGKMKIFEDGVSDQTSIPGQITRWDDIGTVESNRKQNTVEPTAWKGQKLPMKATTSSGVAAARPAKMKVFEDLEVSDPLPASIVSSKVAGMLGGHVALGNPSEQLGGSSEQCDYELLKSNPLRHHKSWSDKNIRMLDEIKQRVLAIKKCMWIIFVIACNRQSINFYTSVRCPTWSSEERPFQKASRIGVASNQVHRNFSTFHQRTHHYYQFNCEFCVQNLLTSDIQVRACVGPDQCCHLTHSRELSTVFNMFGK